MESVTVHVLGKYKPRHAVHAGAAARALEVYTNDEGTGIDIDKVSVCATLV